MFYRNGSDFLKKANMKVMARSTCPVGKSLRNSHILRKKGRGIKCLNARAGGLQLQDCLPVRGRRGVPQGEVMPGSKIDSRLAISHPDRYIFNLIFSPGRLRRLRRHPLLRRHRHHLRRDQLRVQRQGHRPLPAALRLHGRVPVPQLDGHHHAVQLRRGGKEEIVQLFYERGAFPLLVFTKIRK